MKLDEAIKHCEEKAKSNRNEVERGAWEKGSLTEQRCIKCAEEHEQLAEWLKDYKRLLEERTQGEWVPVSERLPEEMQTVLIWFEYFRYGEFNRMYQTYGFGYVYEGKFSSFINGESGWDKARIIAWQPLPEPYKEEGESDADS